MTGFTGLVSPIAFYLSPFRPSCHFSPFIVLSYAKTPRTSHCPYETALSRSPSALSAPSQKNGLVCQDAPSRNGTREIALTKAAGMPMGFTRKAEIASRGEAGSSVGKGGSQVQNPLG